LYVSACPIIPNILRKNEFTFCVRCAIIIKNQGRLKNSRKKSENMKYYITTPIYYPSGKWHIGHCYTTIICDAIARFHRMKGEDVFFTTGTDEHGQKVEKEAAKRGVTPLAFITPLVDEIKEMWSLLDVSYNRFIRTTDPAHAECVQKIYQKLYDSGDIYKSEYEGYYCVPCESMWTEAQLVNGKCPDCGREVERRKEESYFFRLSKYAPKILKHYGDNPEFLQPKSRVNEMVNNFLKEGLQDLSVSRTNVKWGVPLPFDERHTAYVWVDALINYLSVLGYLSADDSLFKKYWSANLHLMGKEIVRFHAIIWPAILMALGLPLPERNYGHGWLLIGGEKLSKSKETGSEELTDPYELVKRYGADAVRYFLLREIPFGSDGEYTNERFLLRVNADLANDFGNLVSRTEAMILQNFGCVPQRGKEEAVDKELIALANGTFAKVESAMEKLNAPDALSAIFALVSRANKYIDETTPWALAKDPAKKDRLGAVLYNLAEVVRMTAILLKPFLTKAPALVLKSLSQDENAGFEALQFGGLKGGEKVEKLEPLFPRIDVKKEMQAVAEFVRANRKKSEPKKTEKKQETMKKELITIDEFDKVEIRVGEVVACEKVAKSEKLLHETVRIGGEVRSVVSGIGKFYTPEEMVGKKVVVVTNLKPAKLCGVLSEGMILCAEDGEGNLSLVSPEKLMESGGSVR